MAGFNLIATANTRDRGVNEMSSALRRRFNTVLLPLPATVDEELEIVRQRVGELGSALELAPIASAADELGRVVTVFRELREGRTLDGRQSLKSPSGTLSSAEAISVVTNGLALATHFGDGTLSAADVAAGIVGTVVRDPSTDTVVWRERTRCANAGWGDSMTLAPSTEARSAGRSTRRATCTPVPVGGAIPSARRGCSDVPAAVTTESGCKRGVPAKAAWETCQDAAASCGGKRQQRWMRHDGARQERQPVTPMTRCRRACR